jgi:hypothetical protein
MQGKDRGNLMEIYQGHRDEITGVGCLETTCLSLETVLAHEQHMIFA